MKSDVPRLSLSSLDTRAGSDEDGSWHALSYVDADSSDSDGAGATPQSAKQRLHSRGLLDVPSTGRTVLFLDWDDTLFASTELMDRRLVTASGNFSAALEAELGPWRLALQELLQTALATCGRVVILTNAVSPWVDICVARFAPDLQPLFSDSGIQIVYADEALRAQRATQHACRSTGVSCLDGARGWLSAFIFEENVLISERELRDAKMTLAKQAGMEQEAARFYGRARWENVISIGDAVYEHDAVCALKGARDATDPFRKDCHVKAITVPQEPSVQELTESLWLSRHLLPAYVAFDGCLDVDQSEVCLADLFA